MMWIPIMENPFPEEIEIDWNHINDMFVVPVPRNIHRYRLGYEHRNICNDWIDKNLIDLRFIK